MKQQKKKFLLQKSKKFLRAAGKMENAFSSVKMDLLQSDSELDLRQHIAVTLYMTTNNTVMLGATIFIAGLITGMKLTTLVGMTAILLPIISLMMFYTIMFQPKVAAKKKARKIDEELPNALRHLLIEVKSGIPLYQSLVAVSEGYGAVSEEFKKIVKDINGGKSETEAIEDSIIANPSISYRRSFWQLLNALKTGTDIAEPLQNIVTDILKDQTIAIKKYGQELNPYTLMYMMVGVIMPSLGITMLVIISTFTGSSISPVLLGTILAVLAIFQLFFMNIIKTKRPNIRV